MAIDAGERLRLVRRLGVFVLPLVLGAIGYSAGYAQGRADLDGADRVRASVTSALEYVNRSATGYDSRKPWYAWQASLDEHRRLIRLSDEATALFTHGGAWTDADSANVAIAATYLEKAADALRTSAPPGAEWYRDGLVGLLRRHAVIYRQFDVAAQASDTRALQQADTDEQALQKEFAALTKRYQDWYAAQRF